MLDLYEATAPYSSTMCCARNTQSNETSWALPEGAALHDVASTAYSPETQCRVPYSRQLMMPFGDTHKNGLWYGARVR